MMGTILLRAILDTVRKGKCSGKREGKESTASIKQEGEAARDWAVRKMKPGGFDVKGSHVHRRAQKRK